MIAAHQGHRAGLRTQWLRPNPGPRPRREENPAGKPRPWWGAAARPVGGGGLGARIIEG